VPLFASEKFRGKSPRGLYGDVVEEVDWSVGTILDTIRKLGLSENTLVFFTSDNGPWLIKELNGGSAGLLRDGKGSTWEGGMREPGLAWWPEHIRPGVVSRAMASTMDLFATCITLAGGEIPSDRVIDGVNQTQVLLGRAPSVRDTYFYYRGSRLMAVRKGPWKAHLITQDAYGPRANEPETHDPPLLYHLDHDPSEKYNVAKKHPGVVQELLQLIAQHEADLEAAPTQLESLIASQSEPRP
jgi:arylsulfatase A-like enzyme